MEMKRGDIVEIDYLEGIGSNSIKRKEEIWWNGGK